MRLSALLLGSVSFLGTVPLEAAAADRPIVAVFNIEANGVKLSGVVLERLTDALGSMIASQGYQIVPRSELKKRLVEQKAESQKICYDASCQIELGKELAAQKSLSTQIIKLGKKCKVMLTLFDLKRSASEAGVYESGGCDEEGIVQSLESAVQKLVGGGQSSGTSATPRAAAAPQSSTPSTADYEKMAAQADAQEKQKAREREKYLAALEQAWASVKKVAAAESMEKKARIGMVEKFLVDFKQDNPHEAEARTLIEQLSRVSVSPASTAASVTPVTEAVSAGLVWVYSKPAKMEFNKTEITVKQYQECVNAGKCDKPYGKNFLKGCNWGYTDRDSHPINCVDWNQAEAFCRWVGGRLPTAQEWEAEASDGGIRKYPWGNETPSCDYAIWSQGGKGCGKDSTWPVCSKPRGNSVSGLCDIAGNVWELTSSWKGSDRVVRGGPWSTDFTFFLAASNSGSTCVPRQRGDSIGFRCGRSSK